MRRICFLAWLALGLLMLGCGSSSDDGGEVGPGAGRFAVQTSALSELALGDAECTLTAVDGSGGVAWEVVTDCSDNGLYIGPCQEDDNDYTLELVLNQLSDADGNLLVDGTDYLNPCPADQPCSQPAVCRANEDVGVEFELTILAINGKGGWFDVTFDWCSVVCSAKLDCVEDLGPYDQGVVFALTCRRGVCDEAGFWQYLDVLTVTCDGGLTATIDPITGAEAVDPADLVEDVRLFDQTEGTPAYAFSKAVAFRWTGNGTNCRLTTNAAAACEPFDAYTTPAGVPFPYIHWDVPLTSDGDLTCGTNPVGSEYVPLLLADEPMVFDREVFRPLTCDEPPPPSDCDPACEPGWTCVDGECVAAGPGLRFTLKWYAPADADLDLHVVTPGGQFITYSDKMGGGCWLTNDSKGDQDGDVPPFLESIYCDATDAGFLPGDYTYWVTDFSESEDVGYELWVYVDDGEVRHIHEKVSFDSLPEPLPSLGGNHYPASEVWHLTY